MITTQIQFNDFWQWLQSSDSYKNNFSYDGAKALFEYLEENGGLEGEQNNYDPVAWCCEFSEYKDLDEFNLQYFGKEFVQDNGYESIDDLKDRTIVISESPLVIQDF